MINVNLLLMPFTFYKKAYSVRLQISVWIPYDPAPKTKRFLVGYTFKSISRPVAFVQALTSINYMYLKVKTLTG